MVKSTGEHHKGTTANQSVQLIHGLCEMRSVIGPPRFTEFITSRPEPDKGKRAPMKNNGNESYESYLS